LLAQEAIGMKRYAGVLAGLTLAALAGRAQEEPVPWAQKFFSKETPAPRVVVHDFGTVPHGTTLVHRFPVTNIYQVPMQITEIRKSCGCVEAAPSASVLQARETGYVEVTMDARKFTGNKDVSVYVTFGPQFVSTATLMVKANSRQDVVLNPGGVNLGVVPQGQKPTATVRVEYAGALNWHLTGVAEHAGPFDVQTQQLYRERGKVGYQVFVTLKGDAPAGPLKEEFLLKTDDPQSPTIPVLVEGNIQAPLAVTPTAVSFGKVDVGQGLTRRVMVRGSGSKPFRILKADGEGDGVTAEIPAGPAPAHVVVIKFQPTKAGEVRKKITFQTDFDGNSTAGVTVEGTGGP
jgi:hypothetical protein